MQITSATHSPNTPYNVGAPEQQQLPTAPTEAPEVDPIDLEFIELIKEMFTALLQLHSQLSLFAGGPGDCGCEGPGGVPGPEVAPPPPMTDLERAQARGLGVKQKKDGFQVKDPGAPKGSQVQEFNAQGQMVDSHSPILLDMDGNGRPDVHNGEWRPHAEAGDQGAHKVMFDITGSGEKKLTEWVGGNDPLLLKLSNQQIQSFQQNGRLEVSGRELMGDEGGKYADGYQKMSAVADANGDGQVNGAELNDMFLWYDKNRNGALESGELVQSQRGGVQSINTRQNGDYSSDFTLTNGRSAKTWDWWPNSFT